MQFDAIDKALRIDSKTTDIKKRLFSMNSGEKGALYTVAGMTDGDMCEKILLFLINQESSRDIMSRIPHPEVSAERDISKLAVSVLSGNGILIFEGLDYGIIIDVKSLPQRSVEEPENDRVLRGPREGFGESLNKNTAMIRKRLRDPALIVEKISIGEPAVCDVALIYVENKAEPDFVSRLRKKLSGITTPALNMSQQSLAECLIHTGWYNPFPKIRYTERPDTSAAMLEEGSVIVVCDNSPQAMILPTSIFGFLHETDDFYFPPLVGSYLRIVRTVIFFLALILTPLWFLLLQYPAHMPSWISFIKIEEPAAIPLLFQLLIAEFMIDGLKLASLNTPSMLSNSLSVVGGLILGDYAVQAGWFSPQTILYMAIVAIAAFTQQSYELGYAFKFLRIVILILTSIFGIWGFFGGLLLSTILIAANKTADGRRRYLYPLIPFNGGVLLRMFFRTKKKDYR